MLVLCTTCNDEHYAMTKLSYDELACMYASKNGLLPRHRTSTPGVATRTAHCSTPATLEYRPRTSVNSVSEIQWVLVDWGYNAAGLMNFRDAIVFRGRQGVLWISIAAVKLGASSLRYSDSPRALSHEPRRNDGARSITFYFARGC